jgi:hypothetical protein
VILGIVEYLPQLNSVKQSGDLIVNGIQLVAGTNEVNIDRWNEIASHPLIQQRIEMGIIRVHFDRPTVVTGTGESKADTGKKVSRTATPIETKLVESSDTPPTTTPVPATQTPEVTTGSKK